MNTCFDEYATRPYAGSCLETATGSGTNTIPSGNLNNCTKWCYFKNSPETDDKKRKQNARNCYTSNAPVVLNGEFQDIFNFEPQFQNLPQNALGIEVAFKLQTPLFSKDDRLFHVMDNPMHKDWVFGVPCLAASEWKGMIAWAYTKRLGKAGARDTGAIYFFGNDREEKNSFYQGSLRFFPTFFYKVGFEVINPHYRATKAGTVPVIYEVVPGKNTDGVLRLLFLPAHPKHKGGPAGIEELRTWLGTLIDVINDLLTKYGISAKRTSGWGACTIEKWRLYHCKNRLQQPFIETDKAEEFKIKAGEIIETWKTTIAQKNSVNETLMMPGYLIY